MKTVELKDRERVDDLLTNDLQIIQSDQVFSFSMDAVLLARFCSVPQRGRIIDLCTGNGVIPLLLTTRTKAEIVGVELQSKLADMAERNIRLNDLTDQISILHDDIRTVHERLGYGKFDLVTVNPPYMKGDTGDRNSNPYIAAARHEIHCTLDDVAAACSRLVRSGGKVAMVHRSSRLIEISVAFRKYKLEIKKLRFVHPRAGEESNMVLIEAVKDGKPEVKILPPLIVYEPNGRYVDELMKIYYGERNSTNESALKQQPKGSGGLQ
ncbi:tRNA1(Val) (adenine(37)-N6)-methyltransferase [Paenibacillus senegalensis]|uniref:tRNA1(Val) (adenine(37)-N6)-methyltransferase n=1 Tax=Paenibacillus senegalensis TaxID=1465766 RepID=UPI0002887847|nr:tRNA1(Val) (adenine(37)-N6)-methyltransferase [Paenibacillus senegalensis]